MGSASELDCFKECYWLRGLNCALAERACGVLSGGLFTGPPLHSPPLLIAKRVLRGDWVLGWLRQRGHTQGRTMSPLGYPLECD